MVKNQAGSNLEHYIVLTEGKKFNLLDTGGGGGDSIRLFVPCLQYQKRGHISS